MDQGRSQSRDHKISLYGRALVVIAAEQYASRLVVPSSQQHSSMRWSSHKDQARKALVKLVSSHLPVTLKQVEKAVAKAHAEHEKETSRNAMRNRGARPVGAVAEAAEADGLDDDERAIDECQNGDLDTGVSDLESNVDDIALSSDLDPEI